MLGKLANKAHFSSFNTHRHAAKTPDHIELHAATKIDGSHLPRAPKSAFRKRPVRLSYDKNEFYAFRLPSENAFLLGSFDKNDLFGTRHGIQHSPHLRAQMNIDSQILLGLCGATLAMLFFEFKRNGKLLNLRENFRTVTYGRFEADDFIEKKQ